MQPAVVAPARKDRPSFSSRPLSGADTAEARHLNGTNLTIWTGTRDGTWTDVRERPGWNVTSLAVDGDAAILGAQGAGSSFLVSREAGSSWQASGGWPDVGLSCDKSVALAATTAISAVNCQGRGSPNVLVADLGSR